MVLSDQRAAGGGGDAVRLVRRELNDQLLPAEGGADPDEIVVTANSRQKPRYVLSLGRDWLAPCSSMTWDNRTRLLALSCRASTPPAG